MYFNIKKKKKKHVARVRLELEAKGTNTPQIFYTHQRGGNLFTASRAGSGPHVLVGLLLTVLRLEQRVESLRLSHDSRGMSGRLERGGGDCGDVLGVQGSRCACGKVGWEQEGTVQEEAWAKHTEQPLGLTSVSNS